MSRQGIAYGLSLTCGEARRVTICARVCQDLAVLCCEVRVCVGASASCRQRCGGVLCIVRARKVKRGESHATGGDDSDDAREHDVKKMMQKLRLSSRSCSCC